MKIRRFPRVIEHLEEVFSSAMLCHRFVSERDLKQIHKLIYRWGQNSNYSKYRWGSEIKIKPDKAEKLLDVSFKKPRNETSAFSSSALMSFQAELWNKILSQG